MRYVLFYCPLISPITDKIVPKSGIYPVLRVVFLVLIRLCKAEIEMMCNIKILRCAWTISLQTRIFLIRIYIKLSGFEI